MYFGDIDYSFYNCFNEKSQIYIKIGYQYYGIVFFREIYNKVL